MCFFLLVFVCVFDGLDTIEYFLFNLFLSKSVGQGEVSHVKPYPWCSGDAFDVFEHEKMELIAVKFWVMSCPSFNGGIRVICYEGLCSFSLKLCGGISCWGGFLRNLWECAILRANFVRWFDSVDFRVFSGVVCGIFYIVMGKNAKCCGWSVCLSMLRSFNF